MIEQTHEINQERLNLIHRYQRTYKLKPRNSSLEAAYVFGCADNTLRKARNSGYLFGVEAPKYIKIGRTVQYRLEDIVDWLEMYSFDNSEVA
jgi:hypothetical protein